ncbi:hypothetical protein ACHAP8_004772 [Fusarium lateritium]
MSTVASTAAVAVAAHLQPHPTIESPSSATPQPSASPQTRTGPPAPHWNATDVPPWLRKHMLFWKVEPTPIRARAWMLEGFDHLQVNRLGLPRHLEGVKKELTQEWEAKSKATPKPPAVRTKRKADTATSAPASKRVKGTTPIKSEATSEAMLPPPPPKLLGNLKGKYAILTDFACCDGQSDPAHDYMCNIVLSPGDSETMRGHFNMGQCMDYNILMFFEKRPTEASSQKVWFRWRGTKSHGGFKKYRGDNNHGWVKFLGDCRIEVWFDKLRVHLDAQKGRGMGENKKHIMGGFWENWHDYDDKKIDLLDTSKLFPDW